MTWPPDAEAIAQDGQCVFPAMAGAGSMPAGATSLPGMPAAMPAPPAMPAMPSASPFYFLDPSALARTAPATPLDGRPAHAFTPGCRAVPERRPPGVRAEAVRRDFPILQER